MICLAIASTRSGCPGLFARAAGEEPPPLALKGLDPVALTEGKEVKGQAEFSVVRDGLRYRFVDAANKARFEKDAERYAIQGHGQCATMADGTRAQPGVFTVYKGRIYAFGCEDCQAAFQKEPEKYVRSSSGKNGRNVVVLIFSGMELLDFTGPVEVFKSAGYRVSTVAANPQPINLPGGLSAKPDHTLPDCPAADIIVVPGGDVSRVSGDKRVLDWLVQASADSTATLSVCTGAFILAKAGLLDGKEATTHWSAIGRLRKQFPKITVRDDRRIVDNGKMVTAAGVSSGIDGALHLVDRLSGRSNATKAARYMEYPWQPIEEAKR
jgi:putative intracellular protease/amidase/YHS domain-containing protein